MNDGHGHQEQGADQDNDDTTVNEREPDGTRQRELQTAFEANLAQDKPPYDGVWIRTLGELTWILQTNQWPGEQLSGGVARPDLRRAIFVGANLSGARLYRAKLSGANFHLANLSGTLLESADLSEAFLEEANLSGADLSEASLSGANLALANLSGANLRGVDMRNANVRDAYLAGATLTETTLEGANFSRANLSGADLRRAKMDTATVLRDVKIDPTTCVADVIWNGVPLTEVDWSNARQLGDEQLARDHKERSGHIYFLGAAARAYRGLSIAMRSQGLLRQASAYRLREQRLERARYWAERKYGAWSFSWILDVISGYGERLGSIGATYIVVVAAFALAFWIATHFLETKLSALTWDEALILSLTSFHGRGFFPSFLSLGDWVARFGAAEAIIGLFLEIVLIATFTRRFLGN